MWRGWRGGFLAARPGLSNWFWVAGPVTRQEGITIVDLNRLRAADDLHACRYLAGILGLPFGQVAMAMGVKNIYGPHHNEVTAAFRRADEWATIDVDQVLAEVCLREHIGRVSTAASRRLRLLVWDFAPTPLSARSENRLSALYGRCLARRICDLRAWGASPQTAMIVADASRLARQALARRTGTAWIWDRAISSFSYDAAWIGVGGDWSAGVAGNPFSPARMLYSMGVTFYLQRSVVYVYAASR